MPVDVRTEIEIAPPRADVAAYASEPDYAASPTPLAVGSRLAFVARFLGRRLAYTYDGARSARTSNG